MRMKLGYVLLLLLATTACTSSLEEQLQNGKADWQPLASEQQQEEENRLILTQPLLLTQQEKEWDVQYDRRNQGKTHEEISKTMTPRDLAMIHVINQKHHINAMQAEYTRLLMEQQRWWKQQKVDECQLEKQQWWDNLTSDQKEHWKKQWWSQMVAGVSEQNRMLKMWGENLLVLIPITKNY